MGKAAVKIIAVGKLRESYWKAAQEEYAKRLQAFTTRLEIVEVGDEPTPDDASPAQETAGRDREAERILAKIVPRDFVIALDGTGKIFTSPAFATHLETLLAEGVASNFVFVIGGSLGLADAVRERADLLLSFGAFTYPHQQMRIMLLEQLFRAGKISAVQAYHK
ncbi:MAG: 23S rRNA (pseudouridine(1915)-N(3))-methyltransferase RlmH [Armatimonadetes bacterium]|nr:23S rRNA (pseudouridine(1915)-N(3))-methyltransferase RlmH [Armatimonadota bacterium]